MPKILDTHFQTALTFEHVAALVEFRSLNSLRVAHEERWRDR